MRALTGSEAARRLEGVIHADTQVAERGVDLTVAEVHALTEGGRLDFGGSEWEEAAAEGLEPELASPDDDYGWWHLGEGSYRVVYNESARLGDGETGRVDSLPRLLRAGASHAAFTISRETSELTALLVVPPTGCHLKENCRISRLTVFAGE